MLNFSMSFRAAPYLGLLPSRNTALLRASLHRLQRRRALILPPSRNNSSTHQYTLRTLNPSSLTESDYLYFPSSQPVAYLWDPFANSSSNPLSQDKRRPYSPFRIDASAPIPAGLGGFLYYYTPKCPAPPTAGEVRFRVMDSAAPNRFNNGKNLEWKNRMPWRLHLLTIAANDTFEVYKETLLRDGLVSVETMNMAERLGRMRKDWVIKDKIKRDHKKKRQFMSGYRPETAKETDAEAETEAEMETGSWLAPLVHTFGQPWYMDFGSKAMIWEFMGKDKLVRSTPMPSVLSWTEGGQRIPSPWLGSALCAFVPDDHPRHEGRRVLRIKILKFVEPPYVNSIFPANKTPSDYPKEGGFIRKQKGFWTLDLDNLPARYKAAFSKGFEELFENAKLPVLRSGLSLRGKAVGKREWEKRLGETSKEDKRVLKARRAA